MSGWSGPSSLTCNFSRKVLILNGFWRRDFIELGGGWRLSCTDVHCCQWQYLSLLHYWSTLPGVIKSSLFRCQICWCWLPEFMLLCIYLKSSMGWTVSLTGQCFYHPKMSYTTDSDYISYFTRFLRNLITFIPKIARILILYMYIWCYMFIQILLCYTSPLVKMSHVWAKY